MSDLYNVTPSLFGVTNNYVSFSDTYGNQYAKFNGLDITLNARPTQRPDDSGRLQRRQDDLGQLRDPGEAAGDFAAQPVLPRRDRVPAAPQVVRLVHASQGRRPDRSDVHQQAGPSGQLRRHADRPAGTSRRTTPSPMPWSRQSLGRNLAGNAANVTRQSDRARHAVWRSHQRARSSRGESLEVRPDRGRTSAPMSTTCSTRRRF